MSAQMQTKAPSGLARSSARWSGTILQRLETMCRYLGLNVLWAVSLALIVTAPGGTRAMLETIERWREANDLPVARTFFRELRWHGVRAVGEYLPIVLAIAVLAIDFSVVGAMGQQRAILFPATLAIAVPVALFATNMQPALVGKAESSIREGYRIALRGIVGAPLVAVLTLFLVMVAMLAVYIQPLLLLIIPAPAGRLIIALRPRHIRNAKETS